MNAASKTALYSEPIRHDAHRRDQLILEHMGLVNAIAAHIQRSVPVHIELDDMVHAGVMGLFDAATKYRDDKEVAFPTYAKHRIRGAILDSLRQQDWASRDLRKRYKQMEAVTRELTAKLERTPSEAGDRPGDGTLVPPLAGADGRFPKPGPGRAAAAYE